MTPLPYPNQGADCARVNELILKYDGDRAIALAQLMGGSCSLTTARQLSIAFGHCFGLTEIEFMRAYRKRARLGQCTFEAFVDGLFEPEV
jgi:hypothetical protein